MLWQSSNRRSVVKSRHQLQAIIPLWAPLASEGVGDQSLWQHHPTPSLNNGEGKEAGDVPMERSGPRVDNSTQAHGARKNNLGLGGVLLDF